MVNSVTSIIKLNWFALISKFTYKVYYILTFDDFLQSIENWHGIGDGLLTWTGLDFQFSFIRAEFVGVAFKLVLRVLGRKSCFIHFLVQNLVLFLTKVPIWKWWNSEHYKLVKNNVL